jgi:tyrosine-protein phosphatase OCA1
LEENNIRVNYIENSVNDSLRGLFPIAEEMVTESLKLLSDKQNYPLMVICKTGKNLVGVVMACLRKMQHWALISIFEEYRRFAGGSRLQQQHEQFIELFDTDLVPVNESAPEFLLRY